MGEDSDEFLNRISRTTIWHLLSWWLWNWEMMIKKRFKRIHIKYEMQYLIWQSHIQMQCKLAYNNIKCAAEYSNFMNIKCKLIDRYFSTIKYCNRSKGNVLLSIHINFYFSKYYSSHGMLYWETDISVNVPSSHHYTLR